MSGVIKKEGNIFGRFKIFAIVSLVIIVLGVVALCFAGFNSGIEFTGGAEISVDFGSGVTDEQYGDIESGLKDYLASVGAEVSGTAKITDGENVSGIVVSFGSEINSQGADETAMNALVNMLGVGGNNISADERASLEDYLGSGFNFGSIVSVSDRVTSLGVADADVSVYTVSPTINNQGLVLSAISLAVSSWREVPSLRHCFQATTASQETYLAMAVSLKTLMPNRLGIFSNSFIRKTS